MADEAVTISENTFQRCRACFYHIRDMCRNRKSLSSDFVNCSDTDQWQVRLLYLTLLHCNSQYTRKRYR